MKSDSISDSNESHLSGVFYADGSCRPNTPGYIGWGVHGYFFREYSEKPVTIDGFHITTHGYIEIQKEIPKNAQYIQPFEYIDGFGSNMNILTHNVAEIEAIYNLLVYLSNIDIKNITIFTDSENTKQCLNDWCKKWEKNNWIKSDGKPVANRDRLEKTYNLIKQITDSGVKFNLQWIRSHQNNIGNDRADMLAGIGMNHSQRQEFVERIDKYPAKKYWDVSMKRNPYIAFRRLYFNSVEEYNRPGVYHISESADADFIIGKPSSSTGYSVVFLNEPDEIIEMIKHKQFENSKGLNAVIRMKLDSVYSKDVYPWLKTYGHHVMVGHKSTQSLYLVNKKQITHEENPTGLSLRALDHFALLEELLLGYKNSIENNTKWLHGATPVTIHDITDRFYQTKTDKKGYKKHELDSSFIVGFKNIIIDIDYSYQGRSIPVKIPYILGYDCLPRNNLKYLETENPCISLITWTEDHILRYATIINSDLGIGIWSNYFANQILLSKI